MADEMQFDLLSPIKDLGYVRILLGDLHDDLVGKVARFHQLADLSAALGSAGTMLAGGETTYAAWTEALSHYRSVDDPSNLSRRVLDTMVSAENHLFSDANFAISMAIRLLALPAFRLGD